MLSKQHLRPSSNYRRSRALEFTGETLHWCCGVLTQQSVDPLFSNEEHIKKVIDSFRRKSKPSRPYKSSKQSKEL